MKTPFEEPFESSSKRSIMLKQTGSSAEDHEKYLRVQDREALENAYESFVVKQFPRVPDAAPAAVEIIFDSPPIATRAPRPPS